MSQPSTTEQPGLQYLPLEKIKPAPDNVRADVGDVAELAASIKTFGVIEPLVVVQRNGHFELVAGARRLAGAKLAKLAEVPAIVREFSEADRIQVMLIENLQREGLSALEEGKAYRRLVDECGMTQRDLATRTGVSQGHVSKRLQLLGLPKDALKELDSGGITIEEALELAKIKDPKRAAKVFKMRGQTYGGIARAVRDELEEIAREQRVAAATKKLEASGARVVAFEHKGNSYHSELPAGSIEITKSGSWNALRLDPEKHKTEPCHAVAVDPRSGDVVTVCTDRANHPKAKTQREIDTARWSRNQSSSRQGDNREVEKARKGRRDFAATIVQGKALPRETHVEIVLDTMISSAHQEVLKIACKFLALEVEGTGFGAALRAHAGRGAVYRQRVEVAIAFSTHEEFLGVYYGWESHAAYLELLEAYGYELTPAERKKLPKTTVKAVA